MKRKKKTITQKTKPYSHELELLPSKALIAVKGFLDYGIDDNARRCLERVLKEYKHNRDKVKEALVEAFKFLKGRHEDSVVKAAKEDINNVAKSVWR